MITLRLAYALAGVLFLVFAASSAADRKNSRRVGTGLFWGLVALAFLGGDVLGDFGNGCVVIALALLAGLGALRRGAPETTSNEERKTLAAARGNWLFAPAIIVPAVALFGSLALKDTTIRGTLLFEKKQATILSMAVGVVVATTAAVIWLRPKPRVPFEEGRRLLDAIGWAALLPQALAALGGVFAVAGVGKAVSTIVTTWVSIDNRLGVVCAYTIGMALFTFIMGNAFAAFPTMTAAIGLPVLVQRLHGDPAVIAAIGMLSGFCGTLMTPMAANFNVVPASLLELPDRESPFNGVIRAQIPTALLLLAANTVLMYFLAFPRS